MAPEDCDPCRSIPKNPKRRRERFLTDAEFTRLGQVLDEVSGKGSRISAGTWRKSMDLSWREAQGWKRKLLQRDSLNSIGSSASAAAPRWRPVAARAACQRPSVRLTGLPPVRGASSASPWRPERRAAGGLEAPPQLEPERACRQRIGVVGRRRIRAGDCIRDVLRAQGVVHLGRNSPRPSPARKFEVHQGMAGNAHAGIGVVVIHPSWPNTGSSRRQEPISSSLPAYGCRPGPGRHQGYVAAGVVAVPEPRLDPGCVQVEGERRRSRRVGGRFSFRNVPALKCSSLRRFIRHALAWAVRRPALQRAPTSASQEVCVASANESNVALDSTRSSTVGARKLRPRCPNHVSSGLDVVEALSRAQQRLAAICT